MVDVIYTPNPTLVDGDSDSFDFKVDDGNGGTATATVDITITLGGVVGEGFEVATDASFTTPLVFGPPVSNPTSYVFSRTADEFCMKIFSEFIDLEDLKKFEYELKLSKDQKLKASLDNNGDGTFTKCLAAGDLEIFNAGDTPTLKLKIETNAKDKVEFKDIPINIGA